jgi:basic amino acid/polyamine antiporter, APA family
MQQNTQMSQGEYWAGSDTVTPRPTLSLVDAIALIVGLVVGAGIFRTPSLVAANAGSATVVLWAWLLGGGVSLIGALCYAELATAYPHAGGDYHFLRRAFGKNLALLFAWARLMVLQTGSIALLAFVCSDYATQILPLGSGSPTLYAALMVLLLTSLNLLGLRHGQWTQNLLTTIEVGGVLLVIGSGLMLATPAAAPPCAMWPAEHASGASPPGSWSLMMIFVLLTYGGWNEVAYMSAEIVGRRRTLVWALVWSLGMITGLYVLVNWAYLRGLGLAGMAASEAVATTLMQHAIGEHGAYVISALIALSALTSANATIITGARTTYAFGRDFPQFAILGRWHTRANAPTNALLAQGAIVLALVLLGCATRKGFEAMVAYTAPIFWLFFLLTGVSLLLLRWREPEVLRPFRVPCFPILPVAFCATSAYMLYASLAYTGIGALVGVAVLVAGVPLVLVTRRQRPA